MGSAAAVPHQDILDDLTGNNNETSEEDDPCDVVVDPTGGGDATTLQGGVDLATAGTRDNPTTVCVHPGTYEEQVSIGTDGVLLWALRGPDNTAVRPPPGTTGPTIDITGTDVFVLRFTVNGEGVTAIDSGPRSVVQNGRVVVTDGIGIDAASHLAVVSNDFVDRGTDQQSGTGIRVDGVRGTNSSDVDGTYVAGNTFTGFYRATEIFDSKEVRITRNVFAGSWYDAVHFISRSGTPDVVGVRVDKNEFRNNTNAIILFEDGDAPEIREVTVVGNVFDDFVWGVLTSTQKVPFDLDNDGNKDEEVEAPGPLDGGIVHATCNYWGRPTGPRANGNELGQGSPLPNWVIPRQIKAAMPGKADQVVEDGVDYRPWAIQPHDPGDDTTCVGGTGTGSV